jgi:hypothetical protein
MIIGRGRTNKLIGDIKLDRKEIAYEDEHRPNLASTIGGGGQIRPWVLGTLFYEVVKLAKG